MEDLEYSGVVEYIQGTLITVSNNLFEGLTIINDYIKKYDPIKFPFVEAGVHDTGASGGSSGSGSGSGSETEEC